MRTYIASAAFAIALALAACTAEVSTSTGGDGGGATTPQGGAGGVGGTGGSTIVFAGSSSSGGSCIPANCPQPPDKACSYAMCINDAICGMSYAPASTPCTGGQCDGAGLCVKISN